MAGTPSSSDETTPDLSGYPNLLTVGELADQLKVDDSTVRRWIGNGSLDAVELPHVNERVVYRISENTLENGLTNSKWTKG